MKKKSEIGKSKMLAICESLIESFRNFNFLRESQWSILWFKINKLLINIYKNCYYKLDILPRELIRIERSDVLLEDDLRLKQDASSIFSFPPTASLALGFSIFPEPDEKPSGTPDFHLTKFSCSAFFSSSSNACLH